MELGCKVRLSFGSSERTTHKFLH